VEKTTTSPIKNDPGYLSG